MNADHMFGMATPAGWYDPNNKLVFWFHRSDGAAAAIGAIGMLVTGQDSH
jgi:hypothetical protein